jgi:acyl-CoA hydrolase
MTAGCSQPSVVWNGDVNSLTRSPKPSFVVAIADVVGDEELVGEYGRSGGLLPLGAIIDMIDLCAGRCSYAYMEGPVVTVSVDHGVMTAPLPTGSLVRVEARVVLAGASSITVEATTFREDLGSDADRRPRFVQCFTSMLTFVAIDVGTGRPLKRVPALSIEGDDDATARAARTTEMKERIRETNRALSAIDSEAAPEVVAVDKHAGVRTSWMRLQDSTVELRKQYLPRHENFGGAVFGGDLMMTLEKAAVYTARRFAGEGRVACVALYGVHFAMPVKPMYLLETTARVVFVRRHCMEVEVVARVDRTHEGLGSSSVALAGYFTVVAHDEAGRCLPVTVGIDLADADDETKRAYAKAKVRMERTGLIEEDEKLCELLCVNTV